MHFISGTVIKADTQPSKFDKLITDLKMNDKAHSLSPAKLHLKAQICNFRGILHEKGFTEGHSFGYMPCMQLVKI